MQDQGTTRSAIGGQPQGKTDDQQLNYNTPAIMVGNAVRDGDEFVLITRSRQGEGFRLWSSGDQEVTEQLYRQAAAQVAGLTPA